MSDLRVRRGQLVDIPEDWQGRVCYPQTRRKRRTKARLKVVGRKSALRAEERWVFENEDR